MNALFRTKRGSSAVFLSIVLSTLIAICFAMIMAAREQTVTSRADALIHLAGESLMGEYHRDILDEYGLFLLEGNEEELTGHLRSYLTPSLSAMKDVSVSDMKASGGRYAIVDPEPIRQQILGRMKTGGRVLLPGKSGGSSGGSGSSDEGSGGSRGPAGTGQSSTAPAGSGSSSSTFTLFMNRNTSRSCASVRSVTEMTSVGSTSSVVSSTA